MEQKILACNVVNGREYDPEELMSRIYEELHNGMLPESKRIASRRGNAPPVT